MVTAIVGANWGDEGKGKDYRYVGRGVRYYRALPRR